MLITWVPVLHGRAAGGATVSGLPEANQPEYLFFCATNPRNSKSWKLDRNVLLCSVQCGRSERREIIVF
jgi:hypothetical protein